MTKDNDMPEMIHCGPIKDNYANVHPYNPTAFTTYTKYANTETHVCIPKKDVPRRIEELLGLIKNQSIAGVKPEHVESVVFACIRQWSAALLAEKDGG